MTARALEIVTFSLIAGSDEAEFIAANEAAAATVRALPGFLGRRLAKGADGQWVDVVEWRDMESAKRAAEVFHTLPAVQPLCAMIDMATARMSHHDIAAVF